MRDAFPYKVNIKQKLDIHTYTEYKERDVVMCHWCNDITDHWGSEYAEDGITFGFTYEEHAVWFKLKFG